MNLTNNVRKLQHLKLINLEIQVKWIKWYTIVEWLFIILIYYKWLWINKCSPWFNHVNYLFIFAMFYRKLIVFYVNWICEIEDLPHKFTVKWNNLRKIQPILQKHKITVNNSPPHYWMERLAGDIYIFELFDLFDKSKENNIQNHI